MGSSGTTSIFRQWHVENALEVHEVLPGVEQQSVCHSSHHCVVND